jgi:hypothetical protein
MRREHTGETFFGTPTFGQVEDYLRVVEYENSQLDKALASCVEWLRSDPTGFEAFNERADAISRKLPDLVSHAREVMRGHDANSGIDLATKLAWDDLRAWRKEMNALYNEFAANPHGCKLPEWHEPQPTAEDPQLEAYKSAKGATDTIEGAASSVASAASSAVSTVGRASLKVGIAVAAVVVGILILRK